MSQPAADAPAALFVPFPGEPAGRPFAPTLGDFRRCRRAGLDVLALAQDPEKLGALLTDPAAAADAVEGLLGVEAGTLDDLAAHEAAELGPLLLEGVARFFPRPVREAVRATLRELAAGPTDPTPGTTSPR